MGGMAPALIAAVSALLGSAVVGAFGAAWLNRRHVARLTQAQALEIEAKAGTVAGSHTAAVRQAEAEADRVEATAADVIRGSALALLLATQAENDRLREELTRERAASTGYIRALAEHLARQGGTVPSQTVLVQQRPGEPPWIAGPEQGGGVDRGA